MPRAAVGPERETLKAIVAGQTDARKLVALGSERLSASRDILVTALQGKVTAHHRFLLKQHLQMIEQLEKTVTDSRRRSRLRWSPFAQRSNT